MKRSKMLLKTNEQLVQNNYRMPVKKTKQKGTELRKYSPKHIKNFGTDS